MLEMLIGLDIKNNEDYSKYREGMTPLLNAVGGGFGYDLEVSKVLKSPSENKINRVFTIFFPSKEVMETFFSNEEYQKIKETFFKGAVESTTYMASYTRK